MSSAPKLTTYKFRVIGGNADDPTEKTVATVGRDVQRAETLFADRGWGKTENRPITSAAAVAYFGMVRLGLYTGKFDEFLDWYLSIEPVEPVTVNPTLPGLDPGSP